MIKDRTERMERGEGRIRRAYKSRGKTGRIRKVSSLSFVLTRFFAVLLEVDRWMLGQ